ncbi:ATP-binding cassette domain-containing protein [Pseudoalteromonas sp. SSM20]|uniref:ATP-binding cassette domain-containing protein n=1 Tax=Pseudoalteromonas sp. SSM20 TaxID=3139394 RepID=UPI003BAC1FA2
MPHIIISNFTKQLGNKVLFNNLNLTLQNGVYGIVGSNGSGKSTFLNALNEVNLGTNTIQLFGMSILFSQLSTIPNQNIAQYLGVDKQLKAFNQIEAGIANDTDFELLNEQWHLPHKVNALLAELGLPEDPFMSCKNLSGGQLARLKLHLCFASDADILLLDEPSNHLDSKGKEWLISSINKFKGLVLIASHDEQVLNCVDNILHFNNNSVQSYPMDYQTFKKHFTSEQVSLLAKIDHEKAAQRKLKKVAQQSLEKAQQRAAQGKKLRASGSQAKVLLDAKKNAADKTKSRLISMQQHRLSDAKEKLANLTTQQSSSKSQHFYLNQAEHHKESTLLTIEDWQCAYLNSSSVSFTVKQTNRIWLKGPNGSGKSTLLKALTDAESTSPFITFKSGDITYLDQHYVWLDRFSSSLDALMTISSNLTEQQARSLLAGVGFKGDKVFSNTLSLSGGEKMKLAMLCVSYAKENALLLLDEPDNHLDIESKAQLAKALSAYQGAFILVSHDNYFVNSLNINMIIDIQVGQTFAVN